MYFVTVGLSEGVILGGIEGAKSFEAPPSSHISSVVRFGWSFGKACEQIGALLEHDDVKSIISFSFPAETPAREFGLAARSVIIAWAGGEVGDLVHRLRRVADVMYGATVSTEDVFLMGASHNLEKEFRDA